MGSYLSIYVCDEFIEKIQRKLDKKKKATYPFVVNIRFLPKDINDILLIRELWKDKCYPQIIYETKVRGLKLDKYRFTISEKDVSHVDLHFSHIVYDDLYTDENFDILIYKLDNHHKKKSCVEIKTKFPIRSPYIDRKRMKSDIKEKFPDFIKYRRVRNENLFIHSKYLTKFYF